MCSRDGMYIVLALFLILFCDSTSSECTQVEPCVCRLPDNHYYNLTGLADQKPLVHSRYNLTVYFHPCKDVPINISVVKNNTCSKGSGVSLCIQNTTANTIEYFGTIHDTKMKLSKQNFDRNRIPIFEIHHGNITSIINIICAFDSNTNFEIDDISSNIGKYYFRLTSPFGCKRELPNNGLSTGSLLVILFFTFAGLYFIGGAVTLKTLRGATGWQMLPNYDFWCDFPSLVKDGIVFTFNCCRADSYERI